uniref:Alternative protein TTC27 n=1 Tax=Homo sapiens TaxID=9606 RepID=L8EA00_HUMAN|nr:alternative protein TTC27 [Homo sapiens]
MMEKSGGCMPTYMEMGRVKSLMKMKRHSSASQRHTSVTPSPIVGRKILHHLRKLFKEP